MFFDIAANFIKQVKIIDFNLLKYSGLLTFFMIVTSYFQYNGVNLRNAKEEQARVIMSQTHPGDNIKLLAQYNVESKLNFIIKASFY